MAIFIRQPSGLGLDFVELAAGADFDEYDALARPEMTECDLFSGDELSAMTAAGEVQSWYAYHGGQRVGWCAVKLRSRCHAWPDAVHLLGNIVFGSQKNRGYGSVMAAWRVERFANRPLTAAIRPGNIASERVLSKFGFRPGSRKGPWVIWHRPLPKTALVLISSATARGRSSNTPEVVQRLIGAGWRIELATPETPTVLASDNAMLWPDDVAFSTVIRCDS